MLTIPRPHRAALGWLRGPGLFFPSLSWAPEFALPPLAPALAGAGGPEEYPGAALGVFSQWEVMAAACTLPTAAVKTASQSAA